MSTIGWMAILFLLFFLGFGGIGWAKSVYDECTTDPDPMDINRDGEVSLTDLSVYLVKLDEANGSTGGE